MRRERWLRILIVVCFLSFVSGPAVATAQPAQVSGTAKQDAAAVLQGFDDFVIQAMKDFKVPGVAVAIVQGDRVVLLKGYGYRDAEKKLPVTPHTLFSIASITKSFTVSVLGMEMNEGKVDWDKPVREYLPGFRMYDPTATEQLTLSRLLKN